MTSPMFYFSVTRSGNSREFIAEYFNIQSESESELATIGMYGVSQGQWPRMSLEMTRCNVRGQMRFWAYLNHAHASGGRVCMIFTPPLASPLLLMAASYVAENTISWKNRSEIVTLMTSALWPDPGKMFMPKAAQKDVLYATQNVSAIRLAVRKQF